MKRLRVGRLVALVALVAAPLSVAAPSDAQPTGAPPVDAAASVSAIDRKLADLDAEAKAARRDLDAAGAEMGVIQTRVVAGGRAYYRLTRAGMLPLGGGFDAFVRHAIHVERARRALARDLAAERALRERAVDLTRTLDRIDHDRLALGTQKSALETARAAEGADARRQQAFDRAFQTSSGAGDYVAVYGSAAAAPDLGVAAGFRASRGRLLFPVAGRAEARPAHREGTSGPGLEIHAALGSVVRAVFAGRVAFADRYGPYGQIVILDHGDHYYSVSGNLGSVDVNVGDELSAGERVGTVGDDGQGAMLYFEIRHGTDTVAPGPWLGLP